MAGGQAAVNQVCTPLRTTTAGAASHQPVTWCCAELYDSHGVELNVRLCLLLGSLLQPAAQSEHSVCQKGFTCATTCKQGPCRV